MRIARTFVLCAGIAVPAGLVATAGAAQEGGYRLTQGDRIQVNYTGAIDPVIVQVDIDGEVRLPGIGGVAAADLTIDEVEDAVEATMTEEGLFVDPQVNIFVTEYAPVIVTGDVSGPGRFDFIPGMTVTTALGLAKGTQTTGVSRFEVERARVANEGQLRILNLEIADSIVELARLDAELAGEAIVELDMELRQRIPMPAALDLDVLIANQQQALDNVRGREEELLGIWARIIETAEAQSELFAQRIAVQEESAARLAEDLQNAQDLQERGLQTAQRLLNAEQREAEARSRILELESAQIVAANTIADAERLRTLFLRNRREDALKSRAEALVRLEDTKLRYARELEQRGVLSGGNVEALITAELIDVTFEIFSSRDAAPDRDPVEQTTPLLPGDTLVVTVDASSAVSQ
ncbi:polysaccharide biosynthesis/export family protein [Jannaschia aquimarina]|uniref:Polysaccharide biosynthesis/export protein n=1 Tax=Jannaschia aquimarina TaxID=935700 RepID=A0A0D1EHH3_9RHOB|nr:polysaccharide biosynthesis/export family protein [Jannaschia aquimarina]KIT16296.1 Polysaccharide biosynthesis/export protein [Jannaschia aquimarina]SNT26692.1 Polysaccharide biosynthesis/export protein [Jannaschia aquimarina]